MTLTIKKDNVLAAFKAASPEQKTLLENLFGKEVIPGKIEDRIKDFNDICAEAGVDPADFVIPVGASQRQIGSIAFNRIQLIFEVANEGWEADWDNSNQPKYYIIWKYTPGSGFSSYGCADTYSASYVGSRLSTFSAERAKWIAETFRNEFNQFLTKTN